MKKIFTILVVITLIIIMSVSPLCVRAESTEASLMQGVKHSIEREMAVLSYFNIIDGDTSPDEELTKLDFIMMLSRMLTKGTVPAAEGKRIFYDCEPTDPYAAEVEFAYNKGIINGDKEGFLRGNTKLKMTDAVVMTIRALGYETVAQQNGGYPTGYLITAGKLNLTRGVSGSYDNAITLSDASKIVFNAMNAPSLEVYLEYNDDTYMVETNKTILSSVYDVSMVKGVIDGNRYVSLPTGKGMANDEITINGMRFKEGNTDATNLLGYYVEGYFITDDYDNRTLIHVDYSKNNVIRFNADDCIWYKPGEISYYDQLTNKEIKKKVSPLASTTVNYTPYKMTGNMKLPVSGDFEIIDNDDDEVYDVVRVNSYEVFVVSGKNGEGNLLYNKNNTADNINLDDYELPIIKSTDGTMLGKDSLEGGKTYFVQRNKDIEYLCMIELDKNATVTVGEFDVQDGDKTVTDKESNVTYGISPFYDKLSSNPTIKLGDTYNFVLDIYGDICAVKSNSVSGNLKYGYLVNYTRSFRGIDETVKFRIFDSEGEFLMLTAEKRIKTNLYDTIKATDLVQKNISDGIIMYSVNQEGKLNELNFPVDNFEDGFKLIGETGEKNDAMYKNQSGTIGGKILLDKDTIIFVVPEDISEEEKFYIYKSGNMVHNNYYSYSKGYSSNSESFVSEAVVIPQESTAMLASTSSVLVVQEVSDYYNEETGETGKKLKGYADGVYKELPVWSSISLSYTHSGKNYMVAEGDVIKFAADKSGKIMSFSVLFSNDANAVLSNNGEKPFTNTERDDYGTIMQRMDNCFKIMHSDESNMSDDLYVIQSSTGIYEFDSSNRRGAKLSAIDYNQIESKEDNPESNATVYVRLVGSAPTIVVIYK